MSFSNCAVCFAVMKHSPGRGAAKKYCGDVCKSVACTAAKESKQALLRHCAVPECGDLANRVGSGLCEKHYMRLRRKGTTDYFIPPSKKAHSAGYVLSAAPKHPRSLGGFRAYEHRVVYTDAHGEGPFYCYWCGKGVTWQDMHIDHLDANKLNNALCNLVSSCPLCNKARGIPNLRATLLAKFGITFQGQAKTRKEWASALGISSASLSYRLASGWTLERALTQARGKTGPRSRIRIV